MERVDLHGIRPVDKRTVASIQFSARGSKELHAEILHYTYDIHDHCLPRDLARDWIPGCSWHCSDRRSHDSSLAWGSGAYHEIFLMQGWMARRGC